jgi:hypothetical protein
VYRGCAVPDLAGTYFFADYCSDQIWSFRVVGGGLTDFMERTGELTAGGSSIDRITSFGLDARGEIYIADRLGEVFRIVPDGVPSACEDLPIPLPTEAVALLGVCLALASAVALRPRRSGAPRAPTDLS